MTEEIDVTLRVRPLVAGAKMPMRATPGSACFDLYALEGGWVGRQGEMYVVNPGASTFRTGLAFEVPPGYALMVYSRSGHGFKNNVRLSNCVGIIDSDYRGEVLVRLRADDVPMQVYAGDRIAQVMLIKLPVVGLEVAGELSGTERGTGGFGSTGA